MRSTSQYIADMDVVITDFSPSTRSRALVQNPDVTVISGATPDTNMIALTWNGEGAATAKAVLPDIRRRLEAIAREIDAAQSAPHDVDAGPDQPFVFIDIRLMNSAYYTELSDLLANRASGTGHYSIVIPGRDDDYIHDVMEELLNAKLVTRPFGEVLNTNTLGMALKAHYYREVLRELGPMDIERAAALHNANAIYQGRAAMEDFSHMPPTGLGAVQQRDNDRNAEQRQSQRVSPEEGRIAMDAYHRAPISNPGGGKTGGRG